MNVFTFVVAIVAIVVCADTFQKIYKFKASKNAADAETGEARAQLDALEERIRVLERIVTESKHDLRQEIDKL